MPFEQGIYEQLITKIIASRLDELNADEFFFKTVALDKAEASRYLSQYLAETIKNALKFVKEKDDSIEKKIELSNKIIQLLIKELPEVVLTNNLIHNEGKILEAVINKLDSPYPDLNKRLKEIMPYTRLSQSELFTGSNVGISLESEIKKEILSADEICWLVSFIKFSGIRIFKEELEQFTNSGKKLRIITTTYMGATELKAVEFLAGLKNTEVKVSYNTEHERLHAKAYLFLRNSTFDTGYIGSSNVSRSALTNGLEWNLKVTTKEVGHIIDKFKKTFDTYWEDNEFEYYQPGRDKEKLQRAIRQQNTTDRNTILTFFDLKPFPYQQELLEKLNSERQLRGRYRNLIVAATGTGKTVISAFDYKRFKDANPRARLLFVAHKKEILAQAQETFRHILKDGNFGELWVDGSELTQYDYVFASVQTLNSRKAELKLSADFYDYIIIDEVHHIAASSYRSVLDIFSPSILLGLTATPERMDGENILKDFCNVIAAEIRLPEALNRKLLTPFQYFAISDSVDLKDVAWKNGRYESKELTKIYTKDDRRVGEIISNCETYLTDINDVIAIGFCVSTDHAKYMAEKFLLAGIQADYLTSENARDNRDSVKQRFRNKEINYLFVVDIFNEGIDIPEIDTVLFLRPTESLTIFLQQLGRGLRLADGKDCLTVLDFVGNSRPEYDFEHKFRALVGKTHTSMIKEIEDDFPHLPLGCSIFLERKAKEIILKNIKEATSFNRNQLLTKIRNFTHNSASELTLQNFMSFYGIALPLILKKGSWKRLCADAEVIAEFNEPGEKQLTSGIKRILQSSSISYFKFIINLIYSGFNVNTDEQEKALLSLMLHYDVQQSTGPTAGFKDLNASITSLKKNPIMLSELKEILEIKINEIDFIEQDIELPYAFPLKLHGRYTRDQILVAMRQHRFDKKSSNREGVIRNHSLNSEALLFTLKKSEKEYSPTTLYDDYAINEVLFHWQSQNAASPNNPSGKAYIQQDQTGKHILLFVREQNDDEYGNTMGYVFLGKANFMSSTGEKPMNIEWKLEEPMPAYIWKESGKLAVG
ncbi:DEAD/DEAH box helicase [Pedobacter sp. PWIIR3]